MATTRAAPALAEAYGRLSSISPAFKVVVEIPRPFIPLKSDIYDSKSPELSAAEMEPKKAVARKKSYTLNIGAMLTLPSSDAHAKPEYSKLEESSSMHDPFEGLPFRAFAERMGERILPTVEAARQHQRQSVVEGRIYAEKAQPVVPHVPHILPFTRWAAKSEAFRSTLVVDETNRKKPRLSWYHPDDTMVPRDWFKGGLLADLQYYMPFGLVSRQTEPTSAMHPTPAHQHR